MNCVVRICGNQNDKLVGAVWWKDGYFPFAVFSWHKEPRLPDVDLLDPDLIGSYMEIAYTDITTELQAFKPVWVSDVETHGEVDDKDFIKLDLSIYEAWLRKNKKIVPEVLDFDYFLRNLRLQRSKSVHKKAQNMLVVI